MSKGDNQMFNFIDRYYHLLSFNCCTISAIRLSMVYSFVVIASVMYLGCVMF